jgi:hypothetical protein
MNVVIYMPKRQQGVGLNKQGIKPRQRTGLGLRLQTGPRTGQINLRENRGTIFRILVGQVRQGKSSDT